MTTNIKYMSVPFVTVVSGWVQWEKMAREALNHVIRLASGLAEIARSVRCAASYGAECAGRRLGVTTHPQNGSQV